jgi:nucleoside-diphosphate-sugar epimerase
MASLSNKVLITGINSFTARYLREELRNYDIFGCDLGVSETEKIFNVDIRDRAAIKNMLQKIEPDYIIHLGAITFVAEENVSLMYEINTVGTINILEECLPLQNKIKKILLPSSSNVYGNPKVDSLAESSETIPVSHYAASKLAMEYAAGLFFDKLPIIITRPFNYTGAGQNPKFVIPKIIDHFREKKDVIELGRTDVVRDFSDVRFVASVYRRLLESNVKSETVNICSGTGTCLQDILKHASEISGHQIKVEINPDFVRANEIQKLTGSNTHLENLIGTLNPIHINDTIRWMLFAE